LDSVAKDSHLEDGVEGHGINSCPERYIRSKFRTSFRAAWIYGVDVGYDEVIRHCGV